MESVAHCRQFFDDAFGTNRTARPARFLPTSEPFYDMALELHAGCPGVRPQTAPSGFGFRFFVAI
jgi:hypothetical protein